MRVLVFGDSITYGCSDPDGGWVQRLYKYYMTQETAGSTKDMPRIFNLGVGGDDSADLIKRMDNEIKARYWHDEGPGAVVVAIGINDSYLRGGRPKSTPQKYTQALNEIAKIAQLHTDKLLFVGISPVDEAILQADRSDDTMYTNESISQFEQALRDFCAKNNLPLVKIFETFKTLHAQKGLLPDGLHPSSKGHQLIADLVKPELEELLR